MKAFFLLFFVFLLFSNASAATLEGRVFSWQTLSPLNGAVIDFDSIPRQRIISTSGAYHVSLEPGSYQMQAVYYENNSPALYALEEINIKKDGNFVFDVVLFPISDADLNRLALIESTEKPSNFLFLFAAIVIVFVVAFFFIRKAKAQVKEEKQQETIKEKPVHQKEAPEQRGEKHLDKYALEIVDILKRSGNRLTQKELREKASVGEAKVSLIVAELEELGLVKKIKQGRGNIIILKEKQ